MNQLFTFFHGITKKSRVSTIITNNRLSRTPVRQIPIPEEWNTPEFNRIFIQGWRACERGEEIYNNEYSNREDLIHSLHNAWERGYLDCFNIRRTTTNLFVDEVREHIRVMFNDETQTHAFYVGANNTHLILEYE